MSNEMPFKQSMQRLEEIVSLLEKNEIELETAIQYFEEGLKLVNQCDQQLKNFEEKVTVLMDTYQKDNNNE
ncbi:exodeoxyribonuclease VII small subunit [Dielma fastidiosa]|uniref:Exodeoxyribonuclease 7 small subunit n=1 Tax=Dielma fastidiosa TaxID=1034346 RepID=A0A318KGG4_9FIRM|nr:exodeoxyribonuclease VII small subunit [Dielma fastidiosa]PXX76809.1 exodeoxyribonuclease VII small subunit [Dielma fastidiosa]